MESREAVAELWLRRVLRSYPQETAQFLSAERDPFGIRPATPFVGR